MHVKTTERKFSIKGLINLLVRGGIAGILIVYILQNVDWQSVVHVLGEIEWKWLILAILSFVMTLGLKMIRWGVLITLIESTQKAIPFQTLMTPFLVGQAVNILLPFRGGEVARFSWLGWKDKSLIVPGALSILLEKWLDFLILSLLSFAFAPLISDWMAFPPIFSWGVFAILLAILGVGIWGIRHFKMKTFPFLPEKFRQVLGNDIAQVEFPPFTKKRLARGLLPIGLSLIVWGNMILTNLLLMHAMSFPLNITMAIVVLVFIYVALIPALIPGNLGPFHGAVVLGMSLFEIPVSQSLSFAIVLHGIVTVFPLLFSGLAILFEQWGKI